MDKCNSLYLLPVFETNLLTTYTVRNHLLLYTPSFVYFKCLTYEFF